MPIRQKDARLLCTIVREETDKINFLAEIKLILASRIHFTTDLYIFLFSNCEIPQNFAN